MKVKDVPQDPGSCLGGHEKLNYAVGDDGRLVGVPTIGWDVEMAATQVSTQATAAHITAAWKAARAGETSPLGYHMAVVQLELGQLANEMNLWQWQVRRHLRPDIFKTLAPALLARYADVMGIRVATLTAVPDAPDTP